MSQRIRAYSVEVAFAVVTLAVIVGLLLVGALFAVWLVKKFPRSLALAVVVVCMVAASGISVGGDRLRRYRVGKWVGLLPIPVFMTGLLIADAEAAVTFGCIGLLACLGLATIGGEVQKRRRRQ